MENKKILIGVTGSISAYRVCDLIQELKLEKADVQSVLTSGGKHFITAATLKALTSKAVYSDMFDDHAFGGPLHTTLADDSDLIVVAPASCNFIAKFAAGICDDLLLGIVMATQKPILIVPAMNDNMYNHPMTQKNIESLKAIGVHFLEPETGQLVCGRFSVGHIASGESILSTIKELCDEQPVK